MILMYDVVFWVFSVLAADMHHLLAESNGGLEDGFMEYSNDIYDAYLFQHLKIETDRKEDMLKCIIIQ